MRINKFRPVSILNIFMLIAMLVSLLGSVTIASPARAAENVTRLPVTKLLNRDGTLDLSSGFSGSLDVANYYISLDPSLGPVFQPQATANTWEALGTGLNATVRSIVISGTDVYVGGYFTDAGGDVNADYIAKWNGSAWSALGTTPLNGCALSLTFWGGDLYAGGCFTDAGGDVNADYIAKWNGSTWSALGTGLNNAVFVVAANGMGIYAGGMFTDAGGDVNADYIAKWNGSTWSALGTTPIHLGSNAAVRTIAFSGTDVYAGGDFTDAGGDVNADYIAKWNGSAWSALGDGLNDTVYSIAISGGNVFASGMFTDAGGNANADYIAKWNGSAWSALGTGLNMWALAVAVSGGDVYAGGYFTDAGGDPNADHIAKWDGTAWSALGTGISDGIGVTTIVNGGGNLYVGGSFTNAGGNADADNIARFIPPPASSATVNTAEDEMNNDGDCSLREAIWSAYFNTGIDACISGISSDTITFDPIISGGTIDLHSTLILESNINIDGSALDSKITISGDPNGDGMGDVRVFSVSPNVTATFDSLFITKGYASGDGSGLFIYPGGNVTVTNSTFSNNTGSRGGGIFISAGSTLTITNSVLSNNSAGYGGGIYNSGTLTVANSAFSNNTATIYGGGIDNYYSTGALTVTNSTFSGNGNAHGGAIYINGEITQKADITNSTFSGNWATFGAGIDTDGGTLNVKNSTFSANTANLIGEPAGIRIAGGTLNLSNTIIANSLKLGTPPGLDCGIQSSGVLGVNANNLVEDGTCSTNGVNFLTGDPNLDMLADNGGPTLTFALLAGSPSIDAGDDLTCAAALVNNLDQRGVPRPIGAHCDIGSYEKAPTFVDVPLDYSVNSYIERLYNAGITGGCSLVPLMYCPENTVTRAQMAVFLLRGIHGSGYTPPAVGAGTGFVDVPTNHPVAAWIKQLAAEGITGGCGNGNYCPDATVTRAQMAVFLLRSKYTSAYTPPPANGDFTDVPLDHLMAAWIEQLAAEGITGGCGAGVYCPDGNVTRAQMAVFLVRTFNLP